MALLLGTALLIEPRRLGRQLVEPGVRLRVGLGGGGLLGAQRVEPGGIGSDQRALVARQPIAARGELLRLLGHGALLGGEHLDLLARRGDGGALPAGRRLRGAQRVFQRRQRLRRLACLRGERLALLHRGVELPGELRGFGLGGGLPAAPVRILRGQLGQPPLDALAAVGDMADALLQPADFRRRLGQLALRHMQCVARRVVRLAHAFQPGLDAAQVGQPGVERGGGLGAGAAHPRLLGRCVAMPQPPQLLLPERALLLQLAEALRHLGLPLQPGEAGVELAQDVLDAGQVLARVGEAVLGLAAALLVFRDAGSFFQEQPQLLRTALDDPADGALADDGVGARPQPGAEEHVLHVAAAHRLAVDVVARRAVAREHALDGDLGVAVPGAAGAGVLVAEHQLDAGAAGGLALPRAVEDHVLHRLAAQLAGLRLAEHPAHRVDDVRLAAAVGPDHADEPARQLEMRRLGERLEARQLDRIQAHGGLAERRPEALPSR